MKLLLNASNLRHGGGMTLALQLLQGLAALRRQDKLYVLVPQLPEYEALQGQANITLLPVSERFHLSWAEKIRHQYVVFPALCKRLQIDKVVSLGNVAFPARGRPHLVYIQLAQLVYPDSPAWARMSRFDLLRNRLMDRYVSFQLRHATSFAVQTPVMRRRFAARFQVPESSVSILPNAAFETAGTGWRPMPEPALPLRLLFLSRYYAHKNFDCLPELCRLIQERKLPVEISLTLDPGESRGAARLLQALSGFACVRNLGHVALPQLSAVMGAHHGVFLPTLLESFSGTYAEALLHRRYIFTSHYDFAQELLGDAAFYFDPLRPSQMAAVLEEALRSPELRAEKLLRIEKCAAELPGLAAVVARFSALVDTFQ